MSDPKSSATARRIVLCSCEDTMRLDAATVAVGCKGAGLTTARHLCRSELGRFRDLAKSAGPLIIGCTQEAPLFQEIAEDEGLAAALTFVNVRETAGWSSDGANAAPKMAALIAAAGEIETPPPAVTLESEGVTLIYGRGQLALDAAERLKDRLDITVLIVEAADAVPPRRAEYPVRAGRIRSVNGQLGGFEIVIDGYAEPAASSRAAFAFGPTQNGLVSKADILLDLSGGPALVTAPHLREGYLRADPKNLAEVERAIARAADLTGTFDKPRYITFRAELCAHSRSRITGCTRCLDLCPAGAITSSGNAVVIDPLICGGCGQCAAACPTGAASYEVPRADLLMRKLRALLIAYHAAGGKQAVVLLHDQSHGDALIDAAARFGDGIPAHVLPVAINEVGQVGLEAMAAVFAHGGAGLRILTRARPRHAQTGLEQTITTATAILGALGFGADAAGMIATDDPDALIAALRAMTPGLATTRPSQFMPIGAKRDVMKLALRELHRVAPAPVPTIPLLKGAMFGGLDIQADGCTLCHACVTACPTSALGDDKDRPLLKFDESLCVQCGLCVATCPEKVITLAPRLDFPAFEAGYRTMKEEEPFCCTRCAKPFGTKSTIERVIAKLEGKHWMFKGDGQSRIELIKMCEDCRVVVATEQSLDPYGAPQRPAPKTTDDYLRERADREQAMRAKIERGEV
jgi:ferredoxin